MTKRTDLGDGDPCPLNPEHGHMFWLVGSDNQWCPHRAHDGLRKVPPTRAFWPKGHRSFDEAVAAYRAPVPALDSGETIPALIDITALAEVAAW
jgi:hypothetical protein